MWKKLVYSKFMYYSFTYTTFSQNLNPVSSGLVEQMKIGNILSHYDH
jgi:hypothetical protein